MNTTLEVFVPHREALPVRYCSDCGSLLSTGNQTDTCWPCDPTWEFDPDETAMVRAMREAIGEAFDRILIRV